MRRAALQRSTPPSNARAAAILVAGRRRLRSPPQFRHSARHHPAAAANDHATAAPLSTSHYLYLPCAYAHEPAAQRRRRASRPARLRARCRAWRLQLPALAARAAAVAPSRNRRRRTRHAAVRANLAANATPRCAPEAAVLRWAGELDAGLRGAFDVVVASDALFDCNVGRSATAECERKLPASLSCRWLRLKAQISDAEEESESGGSGI